MKLKKSYMSKIDFIHKKPVYIFKQENFLNLDLYNNLKYSFKNFDHNKLKKGNDGKFSLDSKSEYYNQLLNSDNSMKKFHDLVFSKPFFNFFYKNLYFKYLFSQKDDFFRVLKYLRLGKLDLNGKKNIFDFLFSKISINISYSLINNNGLILPHTDSLRKFLSLMIYFPEFDDSNEDKKLFLNEKDYGTTFWNSSIKNFNNEHISNEKKNEFIKKSEIFYTTPFEQNVLYGFIRNNNSWHSVEPKEISKDYIRKSININFMYLN